MNEIPEDIKRIAERVLRDEFNARVARSLFMNKAFSYSCEKVYRMPLHIGLTMLMDQDCKCALCKINFEDVSWTIDHCHRTGRVRGLLCRKCNSWLGHHEDKVLAAMKYLEMPNDKVR